MGTYKFAIGLFEKLKANAKVIIFSDSRIMIMKFTQMVRTNNEFYNR